MLLFLNKPFPHNDFNKRTVRNNFLVGCFVALFLILFEPFGIAEWETNGKALKLAGFGLVSFIIPLIMQIIISRFIIKDAVEDKWTVGKEIIAIIAILVFIAFGNLLYGNLLNIMPLNLRGFLFALVSVVLIGVFPVSLHVMRKHNILLKINSQKAVSVNQYLHPEEIKKEDNLPEVPLEIPMPGEPGDNDEIKPIEKLVLIAENEKDKIVLLPEQLLYIESADNYSNIVFIENEQVKKQLLRSSLKRIETQLKSDLILRCHRTFIVNLKNVKNVEGNAAGYKLSFEKEGHSVPVSRNYGNLVLEKLKAIK